MDGRGRALDNIFIERLWRSVKYEDLYLQDYASVPELEDGLGGTSISTTMSGRIRVCSIGRQRKSISCERGSPSARARGDDGVWAGEEPRHHTHASEGTVY